MACGGKGEAEGVGSRRDIHRPKIQKPRIWRIQRIVEDEERISPADAHILCDSGVMPVNPL
jgi:hypothetical protein